MSVFTTPYCGENRALTVRFANHFRFLTRDDPGAHNENLLEKVGDVTMWPSVHIPVMIRNACKDPRVLTIALGALAMLADSYLFYPVETHDWVLWAFTFLSFITLARIRYTSWGTSLYQIGAVTTRAFGRAVNTEYMNQFYQSAQVPENQNHDHLD